jgi:hypothetical protein
MVGKHAAVAAALSHQIICDKWVQFCSPGKISPEENIFIAAASTHMFKFQESESTMEARRSFFANTAATGVAQDERQTKIAQQMEKKQRELRDAKLQEERILAEAERRRQALSTGSGETPPPLPSVPPPEESPPLPVQPDSAGQR